MKNILLKGLFIFTSFILITQSASAMTCTSLTKALSKGSKVGEVLKLQQFLFDNGYLTAAPNGYYGVGTTAAVKKFQAANGLSQVGFVGLSTRNKIKSLSCQVSSGISPINNNTSVNLPIKKETKLISDTFINNLSSCTKYKENFVHPFNGATLNREILGIIDGKCDYIEQMPSNGKMECKYTDSMRAAAVQYYKDIQQPSADIKIETSSSIEKTNSTTTVNGAIVKNSLQTFLDNGACVVSGY